MAYRAAKSYFAQQNYIGSHVWDKRKTHTQDARKDGLLTRPP